MRIYDKHANPTGNISDDTVHQFVRNIVIYFPELRGVKSTEDAIPVIGCTSIPYQKYYDLLQSTVHTYDASISSVKKTYRYIYVSTLIYDHDPDPVEYEPTYDITTPIDIIHANLR